MRGCVWVLAVAVVLTSVYAQRADDLWDALLAMEVDEDVMLGDGPVARHDDDSVWNALVASGWPTTAEVVTDFTTTPDDPVDTTVTPSEGPRPETAPAFGAMTSMSSVELPPSSAQSAEVDAVSLAFVFDSTGSMWRDLEQVKRGAAAILAAMMDRHDKPIHDYVFVPFNDPEVGPATVTSNADTFRAHLDAVNVRGGSDCPEPSLTALLQALKLVRPNSYIYVFTDASAKDYNLLPDVLSQIQKKQTQVVFVMTGNCGDSNSPRYQSMENIAAASSGQVYHINKTEVENVLSFVRQTLESQKVNLVSVDLPEAAKEEHSLPVDETIREFTVSVSGENPHISVVNPDGVRIDQPPTLQNILDLDNVKVVAVKEPSRGSWTVETSSDSKHAVRLTGLSVIDFAYGFSAQVTDRLDETYHRPLQDAPNFILVGGIDEASVWNLTSVDLLAINGSRIQSIPLSQLASPDGLYRGGPFLPPGEELFYLANVGYGRDGYPIKRITPTAISAQAGGLPIVQLQAEERVWLNGSLNLRCQIDSLIPFTAWFYKDGVPISKKQKYQQTALMSMRIDGLTETMGGTYVCRASNVKGFSKDSAQVIVTGSPPEVVTKAEIRTLPHRPVILDCFVRSHLKVNITWVRINSINDQEFVDNNARYIILPNSSIVIDPALPEDTGLFSCVAENQGGRRESKIKLFVNEPLSIRVDPKNVHFKVGDPFSIACQVNSRPSQFYWEKNGHILQDTEHFAVEAEGYRLVLHFKNPEPTDQAVYRCVGMNDIESVEDDAEVLYVEMPTVLLENKPNMIKAGDQVFLKCNASGIPKPKIRWLWQGIDVKSFSNFKVLEDETLHISPVELENAGQIDCVAQNSVGEMKDSVNLTVGYPPLVLKRPTVLQLEIEGTGVMVCNGSGVPNPQVQWERSDGRDMDSNRVQFDTSTGSLIFSDAELDDEGVYLCLLQNEFGSVVLEGTVEIIGIIPPAFEETELMFEDITSSVGREVELTCGVLTGKPSPHIVWFKDGNQLDSNTTFNDVTFWVNDSLKIIKTDPKHSGKYRCEARNVGGSVSRVIQLNVMDPPVLDSSDHLNLTEKVGNNALLPCHVYGTPQPDILWLQSDSSPIALTERIIRTYEGLVIIGVRLEDAGKYSCLASNLAGSTNRSFFLAVQDPPHIYGETMMELVANVGDLINLPCEASGEPTPEYMWSHNYGYLSFDDHFLQGVSSNGLVITSVNINDAGEYLCSAVNDAGSANKTIRLTVQAPPVILTSDPTVVSVTEGDTAKLMCRAEGVPEPSITWTFKGQSVTSETQSNAGDDFSLILPNVQEANSGSYICTAYNFAGSDARAVKLTVKVMAEIEDWKNFSKVMEGEDLLLTCNMRGVPAPRGLWFKNGVPLPLSVVGENYVQYKVEARQADAGVYECQAENDLGSITKSIQVQVLAPPHTLEPSHVGVKSLSGQNVSLECISSDMFGYPIPTIDWIFDGHKMNMSRSNLSSDLSILNIEEVKPLHSGEYVCIVVNEAGNSSRNFSVSIQEPPHILEHFLEKKTLMEGEDFSLPCSADGIPTPRISWVFNNKSVIPTDLLLMNDNTLVIISAQANTSGVYSCIAQNEVGEDMQQTLIEIYVPPSMSRDDTIHEEVNEGDNIMLTCPSSDATAVEWKQNGEPIDFTANERSDEAHFKLLDGGRTLAIYESRPPDNGTYSCTASNPVGERTATFFLEVLWAPFFEEFGISLKEYKIVEGANVSFDCLSSGSPAPKVIWRINESLPVTERTAPGVVVLPTSRHLLSIPVVRAHHDGLYKCQAINKLGFSFKKFRLHVIVPPYLEEVADDHYEVLRGDTVTLVCPVLGFPRPNYFWDFKNSGLQADLRDWNRVEFRNNSQTIVIPNIDFSDGGVYVCNGSNLAGFKIKTFNVSIMGLQNGSSQPEAPSILHSEIEEELSAANGSIILECTANGQPLPDLQWTHNGHVLSSDNIIERSDLDTSSVTQMLTLTLNSSSHSGKYVCHATNNQGAAEKIFRVRLLAPPKIDGEVTTVVENVKSISKLSFSLNCPSLGEPDPLVVWYSNGSLLESDENVLIDFNNAQILHFKQLQKHHSGNYTCKAENIAGSVSKIFLLDVLVPPFHPDNVEEKEVHVLRYQPLTLNCNFQGYPSPDLMWIKGIDPVSTFPPEHLYLTDANSTLVIPSADLSHSGRYSCLAFNEAGSAELMFHVRVSEPPHRNEAVTRNFTSLVIRPLRRFMLLCAMVGSPSPNITWFKNDLLLDDKSLNGSIQISTDGRQLHILNAFVDHEGIYKCHAENNVGSSSAFFELVMDDRGDWGEWSDWSLCSVSCGFGAQERKRDCLTSNCPGEPIEIRPCFMSYCPINGGWSNWTNWTECEGQCGNHERTRFRECNNPEPNYGGLSCEGDKEETEDCHFPPCPIDGKWSAWSDWSVCSVTCGSGSQVRHRYCNNPEPAHGGLKCVGYDSDIAICNEEPCAGSWSEWSEWTQCSATCGPGMRHRRRKCISQWSECLGDNKQFEYCKLRRCVGDGPRKAHIYLHGNLNGFNMRNDTFYADISEDEETKRSFISTSLHQIKKRGVSLQPLVPLLVSPVSWNAAYEDMDARNGFSLTKGYFNQNSHVYFATGEEIKMRHVAQGMDSAGQLKVDIEVIGEVPYIQPKATIVVHPFSEDFVQTGPNTLYVSSQGALSADGNLIPYTWNSTVSYNHNDGAMPYFSEKMSTDFIEADYDSNLQEMRYKVSSVISKRFDDNKCPEGFKLNAEQQHCEDIDECLDISFNKCHSTQICQNLLGTYRCSCPKGFRSLKIGSYCLDLNECLQEPPLCSHECRNVPGSYHCICPPGTFLLEDRHSCSIAPYWDDPDEAYGTSYRNGESSPVSNQEGAEDSRTNEEDHYYSHGSLQEFRLADEDWSCAEGLVWKDGLCQDRDECHDEPDICGEDETCLNMYQTFKCIYTPCEDGYKRDAISRECLAQCSHASPCSTGAKVAEKKVFMAVALDSASNEPGMDLIHLSVSHDHMNSEKLHSHTKYYFGTSPKGKMFRLRQEMGECVVLQLKKLRTGKVFRVEVRGDTFSDDSDTLLFSTQFTIFFHVLKNEGH